ncbi:MAG: hypothetical protein IKF78_05700 [Atopobiaceae bacterium]|nr:hypothetical protein [Atopobiaceae bacterium]
MGRAIKRLIPLWISYIILFGLSALGPLLSRYGGIGRGHWVFLFLMPFAIGSVPYSFIMGEIVQHRTRATGRVAWRWGLFHVIVVYAIFIVGIFDMLLETSDILYYIVWLAPSIASGLFFVLGMLIMRVEQSHSDARYGVEVSRGDPWASFFDLQWEDDSPRVMNADGGERNPEQRPRRRVFRRNKKDQESAE